MTLDPSIPGRGYSVVCSWARLYSHASASLRPGVQLSTSKFNASHPGWAEIHLVASCYRNRDKLRPGWSLGMYTDFTFPVAASIWGHDHSFNDWQGKFTGKGSTGTHFCLGTHAFAWNKFWIPQPCRVYIMCPRFLQLHSCYRRQQKPFIAWLSLDYE